MGALQVATQYPLQSKAFTWLLSVRYLLSYIPHSVFIHSNAATLMRRLRVKLNQSNRPIKPQNTCPAAQYP